MTNEEIKLFKKLLIYLYVQFDGDQTKIFQELIEKNLNVSRETIEQFEVDENAYRVFFEKGYPKKYKEDLIHPVLVYKKTKK